MKIVLRKIFFTCMIVGPLTCVAQIKSPVLVEVNAEMELFSIVTYLSGNIGFVIPNSYEALVKKEFRSFRRHPAVSDIKKLYKGKNMQAEVEHPMLAFYCSALPQLESWAHPPKIGDEEMNEYLKYLRNFSDETNYPDFFASQKEEFKRWEQPVIDSISKYSLADKLGDLFGKYKEFRVYLNPFNSWGGQAFTPTEEFSDNKAWFRLGYNVYPKNAGKKTPPFFNNKAMLFDLIWHEGGHSYINPRVDKHLHLFSVAEALLNADMQTRLQKAGRFKWEWPYFIKEQITRAAVAYLYKKHEGETNWEIECQRQEAIGFIYTKDISLLFGDYDQDKNKYPDFSDFLPLLAQYFKTQIK